MHFTFNSRLRVNLRIFNHVRGDISSVTLLRCSLFKNLCDKSFICPAVTFGIDPSNFYFVANLAAFELERKIGITRYRSTKVHMQYRPTIARTTQGLYEMRKYQLTLRTPRQTTQHTMLHQHFDFDDTTVMHSAYTHRLTQGSLLS